MISLWGDALPPEQPHRATPLRQMSDAEILRHRSKDNPCVRVFGQGPDGRQCKDCAHLRRKHYDKTYIKCNLRPNTNGPGTDHRARWAACSKFKETQEA